MIRSFTTLATATALALSHEKTLPALSQVSVKGPTTLGGQVAQEPQLLTGSQRKLHEFDASPPPPTPEPPPQDYTDLIIFGEVVGGLAALKCLCKGIEKYQDHQAQQRQVRMVEINTQTHSGS